MVFSSFFFLTLGFGLHIEAVKPGGFSGELYTTTHGRVWNKKRKKKEKGKVEKIGE